MKLVANPPPCTTAGQEALGFSWVRHECVEGRKRQSQCGIAKNNADAPCAKRGHAPREMRHRVSSTAALFRVASKWSRNRALRCEAAATVARVATRPRARWARWGRWARGARWDKKLIKMFVLGCKAIKKIIN